MEKYRLIYCTQKFTTEVQQDHKDRMHLRKDIFPADLGADWKYLQSLGGGSKSKHRYIKDHKVICNSKDGKKVD